MSSVKSDAGVTGSPLAKEAMSSRIRTPLAVTAALAAALLAVPASAGAACATVTGSVTGSALSVSTTAKPSFSANLESGDQTPTYTVPLTSTDTHGSGSWWRETST